MATLKIIPVNLLDKYKDKVFKDLELPFSALKDAEVSTGTFSFYTSVSAIASSRIEGEHMEIDSYIKHKMLGVGYQPDLVQKPNDLYNAYMFSRQNKLSEGSLLSAHKLISAHFLPKNKRGVLRKTNMVVMEHQTGRIRFEAAPAHQVENLLHCFGMTLKT